jgi:hypothetical protein
MCLIPLNLLRTQLSFVKFILYKNEGIWEIGKEEERRGEEKR